MDLRPSAYETPALTTELCWHGSLWVFVFLARFGRDSAIIPYMSHFFAKLFAPKRIYIVLGIFVVANLLITFKTATDKSFFNSSDFIAYSVGARMVLDGQGKNLYDLKLQTAYWDTFLEPFGMSRTGPYILPYLAPPLTALLFIPYLFIPLTARIPIAIAVNTMLILAGTLIVGKTARNLKLALLVVFSSWFVWVCVWQIQPTAWLFLVTALLYWSLDRKNFALAGLLCAFYIIKPQYLIIAPLIFLLMGKNTTFVKSFLLSLLTLIALSLLISGPRTLFIDYPKLLTATDNPNYGNRWYEMYSVQQITYRFSRFFTESKIPPLIVGVVFYLWWLFKINGFMSLKKPTIDLFPLTIMVSLLSAYHVLTQDMCIFTIAAILLLMKNTKLKHSYLKVLLLSLLILGYGVESVYLANYYALILVILLYFLFRTYEIDCKTDK